ncbi:MAG TPA: DNA adenine methylase [Candidatus Hydrogenedentes bacterium]|nr:DNA adenine methylase [Candidatus Hydrogenedentota bacterium]
MPRRTRTQDVPRPFLKWAGGKGQLLDELRARVVLGQPFARYHEPFIGGAALFFDLHRCDMLPEGRSLLSDTNERLIEAYLGVRDDVDGVIARLRMHAECHSRDYYYQTRARVPDDLAGRAARIIYLNRTCFNGLYRENSQGEFNVPVGDYRNPMICDEANLRAVASALSRARIEARPFATVLDYARPDDFVYFDPPYHPISKTASFTAYAKDKFGESDQRELAAVFAELTMRGVKALLSNSMTDLIRDLYRDFTIEEVYANRAINSNAARRGKVPEALIRNF